MEVLQDTYKDTKIGRIPKDWKLISFGDLGEYYGGLSGKTKVNFGSGKPYIPFMNIMANDIIDVNYFDLVEIKGDEKQNKAVKGDVFFNTSSETPEEVGMCAVLLDDISDLYLNSFCFGFRLNEEAKKRYLPEYISRFMNSGFGRRLMFPLAQGMTRYNLSKKYFVKLEIPFPSLPEQQKIAAILSTVDEQISTTDQIIEKSKELKKGLMQKLFSEGIGHTEFKDTKIGRIPKDWNFDKLSNLINLKHGYQFRTDDFTEVGIPIIKINNITGGELDTQNLSFIDSNRLNQFKGFKLFQGDILMSLTGNIGKVIEIKNLNGIYLQNYRVGKFTSANESVLHKSLLKYILSSKLVMNQLSRFSNQSAQANFGKQDLDKIWFGISNNLDEQQKIAAILSEADAKIEKEQEQKTKLEQLKRGLMQQLLTGKKRVKV
jgi:type I restriction enzyme, S subunit